MLISAAELVGARVVSMTEPFVGFVFASAEACDDARERLKRNPDLNVEDMTEENLPWSLEFMNAQSDAFDTPVPSAVATRQTAVAAHVVYGECSHQRLPICAFESQWQFEAFELPLADLEAYGIAIPCKVRQSCVRLVVVPCSIQIAVHGVDNDTARMICDWILESPMVAEVCENRLREVALESGAPLSISWGAVQFVAHSCLTPSSMVPLEVGQWALAEPIALGGIPTDASSKALADTARRAVCCLLGVNIDDVFVQVTTSSRDAFHDVALLLFGIRRDARTLFARAHAIVQSVARCAPKHDLPTFDNVDLQMLTRIRSSKPGPNWVCIMASSLTFGDTMARRLLMLATKSINVQVIDLCNSTGIGAEIVRALASLAQVRVIAIAGMSDAESVVRHMPPELAQKMVWTPFEVFRLPSARAHQTYATHAAFYAFQEQARRAWQYWGIDEKEA